VGAGVPVLLAGHLCEVRGSCITRRRPTPTGHTENTPRPRRGPRKATRGLAAPSRPRSRPDRRRQRPRPRHARRGPVQKGPTRTSW
jgi:hypothetical protein